MIAWPKKLCLRKWREVLFCVVLRSFRLLEVEFYWFFYILNLLLSAASHALNSD